MKEGMIFRRSGSWKVREGREARYVVVTGTADQVGNGARNEG